MTLDEEALEVLRRHPGETPEARLTRAVRLQQARPDLTLDRAAAVLLRVETEERLASAVDSPTTHRREPRTS